MTREEYKILLRRVIEDGFQNGTMESMWTGMVTNALATLGPDQWDDILDYMFWDLLRRSMLPNGLDPRVKDAGS